MSLPFDPKVSPLQKRHRRKGFSCGTEKLDRYLQTQASQDMKRSLAAVMVLEGSVPDEVIGFFALSSFTIDIGDLEEKDAKGLPSQRPIPCTLLGQFAIDQQWKGQNIGAWMLGYVLDHVLVTSKKIASYALVVDAVDEEAASYWQYCGFKPLPHIKNRLFLPMKTIEHWLKD